VKDFVLATLKLGLNCNFDRLQERANHHDTVRLMLGHSGWHQLQSVSDFIAAMQHIQGEGGQAG